MENVGPASKMSLEFGSRMNLLTGDNGLGKSFLLDTIWWSVTRRGPHDLNSNLTSGYPARPTIPNQPVSISFFLESKSTDVVYSSQFSQRDQAWTGKAGRPHNPGLVIYAQADGGFSVWDPARNYWKTRGKVDVQDRMPGFLFTSQEVGNGLQMTHDGTLVRVCKGLIDDWATWIRTGGREAQNMNSVLAHLSPTHELADRLQSVATTRISLDDNRDIPTIRTGEGAAVPVLHASAGVKRILQMCYMLLWSWEEHQRSALLLGEPPTEQVVLLIDEIECHLHPRWQRTILGSVMKIMGAMHQSARIQLIAATHSPLVLSSAEPLFNDKTDAWFDLDFDRATGQVGLQKRAFVRLGSVANWLTSQAFDLDSDRSLDAELALKAARFCFESADATQKEIVEADLQLMNTLGSEDRFWREWERFLKSTENNPSQEDEMADKQLKRAEQ